MKVFLLCILATSTITTQAFAAYTETCTIKAKVLSVIEKKPKKELFIQVFESMREEDSNGSKHCESKLNKSIRIQLEKTAKKISVDEVVFFFTFIPRKPLKKII
ncbi:MAG: hypothetical protein M9962_07590 [Oligoflexia bacterium]|nr:hypothetical protein [Oligoflexia bacterium]